MVFYLFLLKRNLRIYNNENKELKVLIIYQVTGTVDSVLLALKIHDYYIVIDTERIHNI